MNSLTAIFSLLFICLLSFLPSAAQSGDETCSAPGATAGQVTGFAVFYTRPEDIQAYVQHFSPLITATRNEPGNVDYRMYINPLQPGLVGFTETYKDFAALQAHLESEHVKSIFGHEYYNELRTQDPTLHGPWVEVPGSTCSDKNATSEESEMAFYWNMNCTRSHIWNIITNWRDTSWIAGSPVATIIPLRKDGTVMNEEEAKNAGELSEAEFDGGLGPVVQRRTWANGYSLDVRMNSRDDESFVTVWETVSDLKFPKVEYDKFFVTISLAKINEYETRLRYHVKFTMKKGTPMEGRMNLKKDFYGQRIDHYKQFFNCSGGVDYHHAENAMDNLYASFTNITSVPSLFTSQSTGAEYLERTLGDTEQSEMSIEVKAVIPPVVYPETAGAGAMALEEVIHRSIAETTVTSRVVQYGMDEWGKIISSDILDHSGADVPKTKAVKCEEDELLKATDTYFETLKLRDIEKVRALYAADAVLMDPVGFFGPRTFDSIYTMFFKLADKFVYTRYPGRTFVDAEKRQTVQLVDADFVLANGRGTLKSRLIQRFTFDKNLKIIKFEAFFKPSFDFNNLE